MTEGPPPQGGRGRPSPPRRKPRAWRDCSQPSLDPNRTRSACVRARRERHGVGGRRRGSWLSRQLQSDATSTCLHLLRIAQIDVAVSGRRQEFLMLLTSSKFKPTLTPSRFLRWIALWPPGLQSAAETNRGSNLLDRRIDRCWLIYAGPRPSGTTAVRPRSAVILNKTSPGLTRVLIASAVCGALTYTISPKSKWSRRTFCILKKISPFSL